jgi:mono/diheme cytochrome c family protein
MKHIAAALVLIPLMSSLAIAQDAAPNPAAGKTLWEGNNTECRNCHGKAGEGAFGPDLAGRGLSVTEFRQAVRKPWGVMPAFVETQISDADLANMSAYFAGLPQNPAPGPWRTTTDAAAPRGQQALNNVGCAQCHGLSFEGPRGAMGGVNADFALFKQLTYNHTAVIEKLDNELADGPPNGPPLVRMGNFNPERLPESQLKEIYDWARNDIGFRPLLQGRLAAGAAGSSGHTYTLNLSNNGLKGKGLTAQGVTVHLIIPADNSVTAATGPGYKGVHMDAQAKANVAEWVIPSMKAKDKRLFSITLSNPVTAASNLKGDIRWAKPAPKSGPNLDVGNIGPVPLGPQSP